MTYDKQTSLPAYKEARISKDYCRQIVLITIRKLGVCNDRQISEELKWPINRVTPRRGELVDTKHVINVGKGKDPKSGRTVNWWMAHKKWQQIPLF
jgi:hypothetical protein